MLPGQEIEVRGPEGHRLAAGELGVVYVKGPNVMLGYDMVAERPVGADGFLRTDDLGMLHESGRLTIQGRADSLFKIHGERVSAKEIERAALESAIGLREVKCIPIGDDKSGLRPILFLEIEPALQGAFLEHEAARFQHGLRTRISKRTWVPREVFILGKLPRTFNGKLENKILHEIWASRKDAQTVWSSPGMTFRRMSPGAEAAWKVS